MRIQIVARHCHVPDSIRLRAEEQVRKLTRYDGKLSSAEVIFEEERHRKKVEGILLLDGEEPAVAHAKGDDFGGSLEQAMHRLQRILRRRKDQRRDHQGPRLSEVVNGGE
jgi:ribosomal subunit interface protein